MEKNSSRDIIAYKLYSQADSVKGYIRPVAEFDGKNYILLNANNFCASEKVFVTSAYDEIDTKYKSLELFKITIFESQFKNPDLPIERNCNFVTQGFKTTDLRPREFVEIILGELPDPNQPILDINYYPSTTYIYIVNNKNICFGPFKWEAIEDNEKLLLKRIDSPLPGRVLYNGNIFTAEFDELTENILPCKLPEGDRLYFTDLTNLHNNSKLTSMDYSSDEDIVTLFSKISKELNYNSKKADFLFLETQVKKIPKFNQKAILDKLPKFREISNENFNFKEDLVEAFEKFLRTNLGTKIVEEFINKNKDEYLKDIKYNSSAEIEYSLREKNLELEELTI
ncbi:hypothetical protein GCM10023206_08170 [Acinetobacter puyangensis]|uniref:Uncharacterized protein n=1 Tax=Acinetobacter puyangensis TaxID=1096779 RepID=A0A240E876_9GAMM|nr:hypothetical protein [Acinetobacter puyangensis]SNX44105.1 hypothetical protein SAMN05421731_102264 [Acinetobacter puyangensis]